jgi:hypothetical protein
MLALQRRSEVGMRVAGLAFGAALCLAPGVIAGGEAPEPAVGYICSAEVDAPAAGSVRQLVRVDGVGTGGFAIATAKPEAQAWFDYGMQLAHAFYHQDAIAAFRKAREADPDCAMCAWGEAWSSGPTLNYDVDEAKTKAAASLADKAQLLADGESARNQALIAALKLRYARHDKSADLAFAKAMDALARRYPQDDEIAIMTSDAWLILESLHDDSRGVARAVAVLEPVLQRHPDETGAIHFYIHATESAHRAADALPYAERLGRLAPNASHLVHMASHTFFRVGRYEDAAVSNAAAIGVDAAYLRAAHDATAQGKVPYHGHNLVFGLGGALAAGDGALALKLADHAAYAYPGGAPAPSNIAGHAYAAYGRFAPDRALALPDPGAAQPFAAAMRHYARGEAFAAKGDSAGVRAEAAAMAVPDKTYDAMPPFARKAARAVIAVARLTLQGRAAMLDAKPRDAAGFYRAAVKIEDANLAADSYRDPPPWWFPERRSLAAALLASGDARGAAEAAREALKLWPNEPLTLQVLAQAEAALGDAAGATRDLAEAARQWRGGTVPLARI